MESTSRRPGGSNGPKGTRKMHSRRGLRPASCTELEGRSRRTRTPHMLNVSSTIRVELKLKLNRPITVHGHRPRLGLGVGPITVSSLRGLELASLGVSACHGQRGRGTGMMCHCASASGISRVDPRIGPGARKGPTSRYHGARPCSL